MQLYPELSHGGGIMTLFWLYYIQNVAANVATIVAHIHSTRLMGASSLFSASHLASHGSSSGRSPSTKKPDHSPPNPLKGGIKDTVRLFTSRLSLRIVLSMFISLAVIEAILLVPSIHRQRRDILSQIEEVSSGKVTWILMTYPDASGEELVEHVEALTRDPMLQMILGGTVYQSNGVKVGQFGEAPALSFAKARQDEYLYVQSEGGDRYDAAWVAQQPDGNYYIVIRHDASGMRQELWAFGFRVAGIVLIVAAFVTLAMLLTLGPTVITPILKLQQDLSKAGDSISDDALEPQFQTATIRRNDELGDVIQTFQVMFQQIVDAVKERKRAENDLRHNNEQMRQYIVEVDQVTAAAAAVEDGVFDPSSLAMVAERTDALGRLARVFQSMAEQVREREEKLRQEVTELRVEIDQAKRDRQVAQITQTDYFQDLKAKARDLRRPGNCG